MKEAPHPPPRTGCGGRGPWPRQQEVGMRSRRAPGREVASEEGACSEPRGNGNGAREGLEASVGLISEGAGDLGGALSKALGREAG